MYFSIPLVFVCTVLFRTGVSGCILEADKCYEDFGILPIDMTFNHTEAELNISIHSPQSWRNYCNDRNNTNLQGCLTNALTLCAESSPEETQLLDLMYGNSFRCSPENLDIYERNYDCYNTTEFGNGWMNCYAIQFSETQDINSQIQGSWDMDEINRLLEKYCSSYEKYLQCTYNSVNNLCGSELANYVYKQEVIPVKNTLNTFLGCSVSETYTNTSICDVDTGMTCLQDVENTIIGLRMRSDMNIMCRSIHLVVDMFETCETEDLVGCDNVTLLLVKERHEEVETSIEMIKDLCDNSGETDTDECSHAYLEKCKVEVLSALDFSREYLCTERFSLLEDLKECLESYLPNCPEATVEHYKDLETELTLLWTTREFNESCAIQNDCIIDIVSRTDELRDCIPHFYEEFSTFNELCGYNQEMLTCIEKVIANCTPMIMILEDEGFFDDIIETMSFYGCNVTIFDRWLIASPEVCQYRRLIGCYSNFLQLVGIDTSVADIPQLHDLSKTFTDSVREDQTHFCSNIDMAGLRQCLDNTLPQCSEMSATIIGTQLSNHSYHVLTYDQDHVFTYNILHDAEAVCDTGCRNIAGKLTAIENSCILHPNTITDIHDNIDYFEYTQMLYWDKPSLEAACRDLQSYTNCIIHEGGGCPYIRHHFLNYERFFAPMITREELLFHCGITMDHACSASFEQCVHLDGLEFPINVYNTSQDDLHQITDYFFQSISDDQVRTCKLFSTFNKADRQQCLWDEQSQCVYGDVYIDKYLTVINIMSDLHDKMCTQDCSNMKERKDKIASGCVIQQNVGPLAEITLAIRNSMLENGAANETSCLKFKAMAECIAYNAGECPILQQYARETFLGHRETAEALLACNTGYDTYTGGYSTTSKYNPQTGEASHLVSSVFIFLTSIVISLYMS